MKRILLASLLCSAAIAQSSGAPAGGLFTAQGTIVYAPFNVGATPQMGVNLFYPCWETISGPCVTETLVKQQADALVSSGLLAKGYNIVSTDAGWSQCNGGGQTGPCPLQPIPANWPDGMAATAAYVHADGAKLELYSAPSLLDCISAAGLYGEETADAVLFASWNIDFLKIDLCNTTTQYGSTPAGIEVAFAKTINALNATGSKIPVLVNAYWGAGAQWTNYGSLYWGGQLQGSIGGQRVRIGTDNSNASWYQKYTTLVNWATVAAYQVRGYWPDPDYLMFQLKENDGGTPTGGTAVSDTEARAQFNAYAMTASPLISGQYISALDATNLATMGNAAVIAVDQDSTGLMGTLTATTTCGATVCQVWQRTLTAGNPACPGTYTHCLAVTFINYDSTAGHSIVANWSALGISGTYNICDLWASIGTCTSEGTSATSYTYTGGPAWGSTMVILTQ
jgi:alpha-galactosidase